jgi:hypothetical protein
MKLRDEMATAEFGDRRLSKRLVRIMDQLAAMPGQSFPAAAQDDAALEATYRFLSNGEVTPERILAPHLRATVQRITDAGIAIIAHDTTEFSLDRPQMAWLDKHRTGFSAHFSLALTADGAMQPLGIVSMETIFRDGPRDRSKRRARARAADSEERRWGRAVESCEVPLPRSASAIHVMDREADSYTLFAQLAELGRRFVIRMAFDRRVEQGSKLDAAIEKAPVLLMRSVPLTARGRNEIPGRRKAHPPRAARVAKLAVSAKRLTLLRPDWASRDLPPTLTVNVVRVYERRPPPDVQSVEWKLVTTEPIASATDVAWIVDCYRARWVIEEYFKALKTGCAFEKRQLESRSAILNALAIFAPIAWRLLLLRSTSRHAPEAPAHTALPRTQLLVMEKHPILQLSSRATVREALFAIARLGGHIKNNGDPGWLVLGRGYDKLLLLEEGAQIALRCDQS